MYLFSHIIHTLILPRDKKEFLKTGTREEKRQFLSSTILRSVRIEAKHGEFILDNMAALTRKKDMRVHDAYKVRMITQRHSANLQLILS